MTPKIEKTLDFLNQSFDVSEYWKKNPAGKNYRFDHTIRVAKYAAQIAENENMDRESLVIAALLHDVSYGLDFDIKKSFTYKEPCPELENCTHDDLIKYHGYISVLHSKAFLENLGYEGEKLDDMLGAISHTASPDGAKYCVKDTTFCRTIGDADEIDHVSAFRFYEDLRDFDFSNASMQDRQQFIWNTKGYTEHCMNGIYQVLKTETARKLYKENCDFRFKVLDELQGLVDNSKVEGL